MGRAQLETRHVEANLLQMKTGAVTLGEAGAAGAQPCSYRRGTSSAILSELEQPEVNLVTWRRRVPISVQRGLAGWAAINPSAFDDVLRVRACELALLLAGMAASLSRRMHGELLTLFTMFAGFSRASRVRVTFGVVRSDRCRKFHVDYARYRLITTYIGPGTQWLPEAAVNRAALAGLIPCPMEANRAIVRSEDAIQHATPGDVLVMKGELHHGALGAVHRSPPIAGTNQLRVVFTLTTEE